MVALGGALGSVARYGVGLALERFVTFPLSTLIVNVLGSLIIGICAGVFGLDQKRPMALLLMVGFCGGFTTFSTFSLNTLALLEQHAWLKAGGNMFLSMVLCLFGTWLGFMLGQTLKKVV